MDTTSSNSLLNILRLQRLLDAAQLQQLAGTAFADAKSLAKELIQRGWLTPYQANQLLNGKGQQLVLGSYLLLERLGEGGMGQVFKARHRTLHRICALKLIRKERLDNPNAVKRFQREVRSAAALSHPHIVHAYDADVIDGTSLLVMEYIEGAVDLSKLVKQNGPLPVERACDYIRQAALGLQHAFERGMVHRDIKPANLLLTQDGKLVKVLDMGLARLDQAVADEDSTSTMTQEGAVLGTPDYIAPEQALDTHTVDIRADLYSLGCTFYFLLTGRVPFPGGTLLQKLNKHQNEEPLAVEQLRPTVPSAVTNVVRKLMAKRPDERYQTPAELAVELAVLGQSLTGMAATSDVTITDKDSPPTTSGEALRSAFAYIQKRSDTVGLPPPDGMAKRPQVPRWFLVTLATSFTVVVCLAVILFCIPGSGKNRTDEEGESRLVDRKGPPHLEEAKTKGDPKTSDDLPIAKAPVNVPGTPEKKAAQQLQRDWAKGLQREVETKSPSGIVMVVIPPDGKALSKPYLMGKYEVTQAEWEAVMGSNPSIFQKGQKKVEGLDTSRFPVESVSWYDSVEFCNKLSEKEGLKPYYVLKVHKRHTDKHIDEAEVRIVGGKGYHLPTDAEWEHACRAGSQTKYHFGDKDEELPKYAWFDQNSEKRTHRVGELKPNAFGLHDMHGNVREWNEEMLTNAKSGVPERASRGGPWDDAASHCAVAKRHRRPPASRHSSHGLRLAQRFPPGLIEPSPYDAIDPAKLVADPALPWRPKELVAVVGAQRFDSWRRGVSKVHLSQDGKTLYASSQDGTITIRDADSGRVRQLFEHQVWNLYFSAQFAVSPDERWLVYQKDWDNLLVWDLKENRAVKTLPGGYHVTFSPDGKHLLAVKLPKLRIIDPAADWKPKQEIDVGTSAGSTLFAVSRDSKRAAVILAPASGGSHVRTFDIDSGDPGSNFPIERRIAFGTFGVSHDDFLFGGYPDPQPLIGRFDLQTGKISLKTPLPGAQGVALSPDGKQLLFGRIGDFVAVNPHDLSQIWLQSLSGFHEVRGIAYSGDGQRVALADSHGFLAVHDAKTGEPIGKPLPHHMAYSQFFALPDGRAFLSGTNIDSRLFDFVTGKDISIPKINEMNAPYPTPDGKQLIIARPKENHLAIVDLEGKRVRDVKVGLGVHAAVPIDGGRKLLLRTRDTLKIVDFQSGVLEKGFTRPGGEVRGLAVDAVGRRAALAHSLDGRLDVYDLQTPKLERSIELKGPVWRAHLVFSRDGQWLACGHANSSSGWGPLGGKVRLWAAATGAERLLVVPKDCRPGSAIAISPGGEELANGGHDGSVHFWDIQTGSYRRSIRVGPAHGVILHVAYTPDGRHLLVNTPSGMVLLLRLAEVPSALRQPGPWRPIPLDAKFTAWQLHDTETRDFEVKEIEKEPVLHFFKDRSAYLWPKEQVQDFHLRLDFKFPGKGGRFDICWARSGGGVFGFRVLGDGKVSTGFGEAAVNRGALERGAIVSRGPLTDKTVFAEAALKPTGDWNQLDLVRLGSAFAVFVNGRFAGATTDLRWLKDKEVIEFLRKVFAGTLQCAATMVRRIQIRDVTALPSELLDPLPVLQPLAGQPRRRIFPKNTSRWCRKTIGLPSSSPAPKHLHTLSLASKLGDYHARFQIKLSKGGRAGFLFAQHGKTPLQFVLHTNQNASAYGTGLRLREGVVRDGRIVAQGEAVEALSFPGSRPVPDCWHVVDVVRLGNSCLCLMDNRLVGIVTDLRDATKKEISDVRFTLLSTYNTTAYFRNLEIRDITALPPELFDPVPVLQPLKQLAPVFAHGSAFDANSVPFSLLLGEGGFGIVYDAFARASVYRRFLHGL